MDTDFDRAAVLHDRKRIARRLKAQIPDIVDQWTSRLKAQLDAAMHYKRSLLVDSMPQVLANLVRALARGGWSYPDSEGTDVAFMHGKQRESLQDYDLAQVVDEYSLIRSILTDRLSDEKMLPATREFIHQYVDANVRGACAAFASRAQRRAVRHLVRQRNNALRERSQARRALVAANTERDNIARHVDRLNTNRAARSRVIAILGHDMRAPLTAVLLQAQRIQNASEGGLPTKTQALAQRIIQGAARIDDMIGSLIEADRIEASEDAALRVESGNLQEIARRAIKTVAGSEEYRFVTHFEGDGAGFWDVPAVLRAIENLCNNALKYGSRDRPITVSFCGAGPNVRIGVHNHGSYLNPAERRSLFDAYFRRTQDKQDASAGWGLGLVQVKQVAEAHGGKVTVHSRARAGTAFCLHMLRDCRPLVA